MSNQTRPTNEHGSWTVVYRGSRREPVMISSGWAAGYTPAHKETRAEALEYAKNRATTEVQQHQLILENVMVMIEVENERLQLELDQKALVEQYEDTDKLLDL